MVTLRLEGLGAAYGRRSVVSGVTTPAFAGGELVAVVGPNASGKSTLLRRIAGLMRGPGRVVLDGSGRGAGAVAYMPQDSASQAVLTVYESVLLARRRDASWAVRPADMAVADTVLEQLGIVDLAMRNLGELSGGQRQLASVAQVLAREPEVLLMDEPTSALDLHRQVQVLQFVRDLAGRRGLLVVAALHDLNHVLRFADRVMVMHGGALHACGACGEVLTPALLREVYRVEARIEPCSRGGRHVIVDAAAG